MKDKINSLRENIPYNLLRLGLACNAKCLFCVEYCENLLRIKQGIKNVHFNHDKVKAISCSRCDLNNFCNGVWKEYAMLYPLSDLKPIRKYNGKLRLYSSYKNL